jgi:hypothetical protein
MIPMYAVARFLLEIIRGDTDRGTVVGSVSTSQFIGLLLIPVAVGLYLWRRKVGQAPPTLLSDEEIQKRLIEAGVIKPTRKERKAREEKEALQGKSDAAGASQPAQGQGKKKKKKK